MSNKVNNMDDVKKILGTCLADLELICKEDQKNKVLEYISGTINLLSNRSAVHSEVFNEFESRIINESGKNNCLLANRIIIYQLYIEYRPKIRMLDISDRVLDYFREEFARVLKLANQGKGSFLTFENSQFSKYIDTLCLRLIPLGCQSVIETGYSRNLIFKQSVLNVLKFTLLFAGMGGNKQLFEIHYNEHRFRQFNPDGWNSTFQLCAELLLRRPEIKGIFGVAWFFDPQLETVSPELKYIRELIIRIGGHVFFANRSAKDRDNAFAMSLARKRAFEDGRYDPASFIAIIPRRALLRYYGF